MAIEVYRCEGSRSEYYRREEHFRGEKHFSCEQLSRPHTLGESAYSTGIVIGR